MLRNFKYDAVVRHQLFLNGAILLKAAKVTHFVFHVVLDKGHSPSGWLAIWGGRVAQIMGWGQAIGSIRIYIIAHII